MSEDRVLILAATEDLCLDFANTLYWRGSPSPTERLHHADDLFDWCGASGGLPPRHLQAVRKTLAGRPPDAASLLRDALALRETIYAVFSAIASARQPPEAALAALNHLLAEGPSRRDIQSKKPAGFGWAVSAAPNATTLLAPVLWSAGDLLVGARLDRVRRCANDACLWLFLDDSKSGNRRWCSMSACGNRAKAHRHYQRNKG
jgi:predicted RNA-binding Zn ribbon-like protein